MIGMGFRAMKHEECVKKQSLNSLAFGKSKSNVCNITLSNDVYPSRNLRFSSRT